MKTVSARQANHEFSDLLSRAERGEEILITKRSKPVAVCTYLHPQLGRQVLRLGGRNKRGSQDRSRSAISDVRLSLDR
jgi:antitoxin (DNA-binding transcriptional repressor) of toxin-antitoxin stability system